MQAFYPFGPTTCDWSGHVFTIHLGPPNIPALPGVYVMARSGGDRVRHPVYIGKSIDMCQRHSSHERWAEAQWWGATEVHTLAVLDADKRAAIEEELIERFQPPLNVHHKQNMLGGSLYAMAMQRQRQLAQSPGMLDNATFAALLARRRP